MVVPLRDSSMPTSRAMRFLLLEWLADPGGGHGVDVGLSSSLGVASLRSSLAACAFAFLLRLASGCGIALARTGGCDWSIAASVSFEGGFGSLWSFAASLAAVVDLGEAALA